MAIGTGRGENRAVDAARAAVMSPLLEVNITGARGILFNVTGGSDLGLFEVNEAAEIIHGVAHPDANIIFGTVIDDAIKILKQQGIEIDIDHLDVGVRPGRVILLRQRPAQPAQERPPRRRETWHRWPPTGCPRHRRRRIPGVTTGAGAGVHLRAERLQPGRGAERCRRRALRCAGDSRRADRAVGVRDVGIAPDRPAPLRPRPL